MPEPKGKVEIEVEDEDTGSHSKKSRPDRIKEIATVLAAATALVTAVAAIARPTDETPARATYESLYPELLKNATEIARLEGELQVLQSSLGLRGASGPGYGNGAGRTGEGHASNGPEFRLDKVVTRSPKGEGRNAAGGGVGSVETGGGSGAGGPHGEPREGLPSEVVSRIARQSVGSFRKCFDAAWATTPSLKARVEIQLAVEPDGKVRSPEVSSPTFHDPTVEKCLVEHLAHLEFPPAPAPTHASFEMTFQAEGPASAPPSPVAAAPAPPPAAHTTTAPTALQPRTFDEVMKAARAAKK